MIFLRVFKDSLKLPNKKSLFKLNQVGMDIVVIYMFILLLFVSAPSLIKQIITPSVLSSYLNLFFFIIYFFIFYYLPLTLIVFLSISLFAYLGRGIAKLSKRKLHYSVLWKMCAFSTTTPFIIYTIIGLFYSLHYVFLFILILYILLLLIKMISVYPKRRNI